MKKILTVIAVVILMVGCNKKPVQKNLRKHIYYTYVGLVDLDSIKNTDTFIDTDSNLCYKLTVIGKDTVYFKPYDRTYYMVFPTHDEHGNCIVQWNPDTEESTNN